MSRYVRIHRRFVNLRPPPERAFAAPPRRELLLLTALCRLPAVFAALADFALEPALRLRTLVVFLALEAPFELAFAALEAPLDAVFFAAGLEPDRAPLARAGGFRPAGRRPGAPRATRLRADVFFRVPGAAKSVPIASVTESTAAIPSVALWMPFLR